MAALVRVTHCTAELCCVLDFAGKPALPALLGRGIHLTGSSGYWVGHSGESFAVELMSDREPGLALGSRGYTRRVHRSTPLIGEASSRTTRSASQAGAPFFFLATEPFQSLATHR